MSFGQGEGTARGRAPGRGRAGAGRLAESLGPRRPPLRPLGHHRALRGAGGPGAGDWPPRPHESAPPPPPEPRRQQGPDRPRIAQRPGGLGGSGAAPALIACRPAPEILVAFLRCSAAAAFSGSAAAAARSCSGGGLRGPLRRRCHRRAGPASGPRLRTARGAAAPSPPPGPARPGRLRRSPTCTAREPPGRSPRPGRCRPSRPAGRARLRRRNRDEARPSAPPSRPRWLGTPGATLRVAAPTGGAGDAARLAARGTPLLRCWWRAPATRLGVFASCGGNGSAVWVSVGPGGQAALPRTLARACRRLCSARAAELPMRTGPRRGPRGPGRPAAPPSGVPAGQVGLVQLKTAGRAPPRCAGASLQSGRVGSVE